MNPSFQEMKRIPACIAACLLLASGSAFAFGDDGEHTDWPDYPAALAKGEAPSGEHLLPIAKKDGNNGDGRRPQRDPRFELSDEHTDWPDYPEGFDPSNMGETPNSPPGDPNDPQAIMPIPPLDELLKPIGSSEDLTGFGSLGATPGGYPGPSPIPAPGSVMLILGLGAAAARRRR